MAIFSYSCGTDIGNTVDSSPAPDIDPPLVGTTDIDPTWLLSRTCFGKWQRRRRIQVKHAGFRKSSGDMFGQLFWKGHLHIIPTEFDLGNVLTTQERTYEIFNGFDRESKQISTIGEVGTDGFIISGQPAKSPNLIRPKETIVITVQVSPAGPVTISANINYAFVTGEFLQVDFTGARVVIMSFEPQSDITEQWTWLTNIIEASSGQEQRISAQSNPKQTWTYRFINEDADMSFLENLLWGWAENVWALPIWTDYTVLTADVGIGDTILPVESTADRDFRSGIGELAILWTAKDTFEAFEVDTFAATTLTSARGLLAAFPAGTIVMPMRLAKMGEQVTGNFHNINAQTRETKWHILENVQYDESAQSPHPLFENGTYLGLPVWDILNDFLVTSGTYGVPLNKNLQVFPNKTGKFSVMTARKYPQQKLTGLGMTSYGREEFQRLRSFLHGLRGRQKAIWVTTGRVDFTVESTTTTPSTSIHINEVNYTAQVFDVPNGPQTRQDIEITYVDGTIDLRNIIDAEQTPGVREVLTLNSAISQDVSIANVARISYLIKRRLVTDKLNFEHEWYEGEVETRFSLVDILS